MTKTCKTCKHCVATYDGTIGFCRKSSANIALASFEVVGVLPFCNGKDYAERTDSVEQVAAEPYGERLEALGVEV